MALTEEIEISKASLSDGCTGIGCQELWKKAFLNCFVKVDEEIGGVHRGNSGSNSEANQIPIAPETVGSTAVVAILCSTHLIVANCGDSRAVLSRGKVVIPLSVDHKVRHVFVVLHRESLPEILIFLVTFMLFSAK